MKNCACLSVSLMLFVASHEVSAEAASGTIATTDCASIVSKTVAEMRVGASAWWSDDVERMAAMAATSACFKVLAARSMNAAENEQDPVSGASLTADVKKEETTSSGLSFRPLSGSASKKPYERARARKDPK